MISSIGSTQSTAVLQARSAMSSRPAPPDPQEMFTRLDTDSDGKVTLEEMQAMPAPPGGGEHGAGQAGQAGQAGPSAEEMFSEFDTDGDGVVSFAEFEARRPPEPPQGGAPGSASGSGMDLAALFAQELDEDTTARSLADLLA